jgi:hypothetical protein
VCGHDFVSLLAFHFQFALFFRRSFLCTLPLGKADGFVAFALSESPLKAKREAPFISLLAAAHDGKGFFCAKHCARK